ncbi:MAG: antibiotic biosynthesis monooxygenase [Bacilli bacterium]
MMFVVCNCIYTHKGRSQEVTDRFAHTKSVHEFEGFLRMEISVCNFDKESDEVRVRTDWSSEDHFNAWVKSAEFKAAHAKREGMSNEDSPIINNKLYTYTVVHEHFPAVKQEA